MFMYVRYAMYVSVFLLSLLLLLLFVNSTPLEILCSTLLYTLQVYLVIVYMCPFFLLLDFLEDAV